MAQARALARSPPPRLAAVQPLAALCRIRRNAVRSSSTRAPSADALHRLLTRDANLPENVVTQVKSLGITSVTDFRSYWTATEYEEGVGTDVLDGLSEIRNGTPQWKLLRGRLRSAWELAGSEMAKQLARRSKTDPQEELDTPIDSDDRALQDEQFEKAYGGLSFEQEFVPADPLYGRLFREFRRRNISVYSLGRVRAAASYDLAHDKRLRKIADNLYSKDDSYDPPNINFSSVLQLLVAARILANGWAMVGTRKLDSRLLPRLDGTAPQVRDCDLTEAIAYVDFLTMQSLTHPGPEPATVTYLYSVVARRHFGCSLTLLPSTCVVVWGCHGSH